MLPLVLISFVLILGSTIAWYHLIRNPSEFSLTHRVSRGPTPKPFIAVMLTVLLILLGLSAQFARSNENADALTLKMLASANLLNSTIAMVLLVLLKISTNRIARIEEYGIKDTHLLGQLKDGLIGFSLCVIPVTIFRAATFPFLSESNMHPLLKLIMNSGDLTVWSHVILATVIIAPILEELMYRVILQGWFRTFLSPISAILVTALIFSSMHGFPAVIALFPLAVILGYIYEVRHSYFACVTTHMLFNGVNLLMILISPDQPVAPGN